MNTTLFLNARLWIPNILQDETYKLIFHKHNDVE